MMLTIEELLQCNKYIRKRRRPEFQIDQRHQKANIELDCDLPNIKMTMFLRRLLAYPEDFTVGLRLDAPNSFAEHTLVLVRFQGPHGGQSPEKNMEDLHNDYHIHLYTEEDYMYQKEHPIKKLESLRVLNKQWTPFFLIVILRMYLEFLIVNGKRRSSLR